jgi:hypothetical protein
MRSLQSSIFRRAVLAASLLLAGIPATATSIINSFVQDGQNQLGSATPAEGVSLSGAGYLVSASTDWGVNHVFATSSTLTDHPGANSHWQLQFTLIGGNPGDIVPLAIEYSFHGILGPLTAGQSGADFQYCLASALTQGGCNFLNPSDRTTGFLNGLGDQCTAFGDLSIQNPNQNINGGHGGCEGTYDYSGTVNTGNNYVVGTGNILHGIVAAGATAGTADASSTARILGIIVPDGITWAYQDGITGNPLNFQNVSSAQAPEPATFAMLGLGLAGLGISRRRRG